MSAPLARRLLAEYLRQRVPGRARDRLRHRRRRSSRQDTGLQLLENAAATAAGLFAIILMFGPDLGRALQPGRLARRRRLRRPQPARRARLHPGADRGLHQRRDRRQRHVRADGDQHLDPPPRQPVAPASPRSIATCGLILRDLRARAQRPRGHRAGRRRRLHRRRLLVHQLDQLREPGDQHRPHVLGHVRRHRSGVGARRSSSPSSSAAPSRCCWYGCSTPTSALRRPPTWSSPTMPSLGSGKQWHDRVTARRRTLSAAR